MTDIENIELHKRTVGDGAHRIVFLHGLFGRGQNFTQIAKGLEPEFTSLLVDLPNHGKSDWTEDFDYCILADHVAEELRASFAADGPVDILGHSMGGKVAMVLSLRHPELVRRLVVEDISPVGADYLDPTQFPGGGTEFDYLLTSLRSLDLDTLTDRREADEALSHYVSVDRVRAFLLQNLRNSEDGLRWEPNLPLLHKSLRTIRDFPDLGDVQSDVPVLWVGGADSDYIRPAHSELMRALFPNVTRTMVKGAGHWLHAEKPDEFICLLRRFLLD